MDNISDIIEKIRAIKQKHPTVKRILIECPSSSYFDTVVHCYDSVYYEPNVLMLIGDYTYFDKDDYIDDIMATENVSEEEAKKLCEMQDWFEAIVIEGGM